MIARGGFRVSRVLRLWPVGTREWGYYFFALFVGASLEGVE